MVPRDAAHAPIPRYDRSARQPRVLSMNKILLLMLSLLCVSGELVAAPQPPTIHARGYILMDAHTGKILAEGKADERMEPASITKIMTAYVVGNELAAGHIALTDQVLVSEKAWRMEGSRMFIEVGTRVSVDKLLKGMSIQSGNDASVALAEHVAGSEEAFVDLMNQHARELGMKNTHFVNATGLPDPKHYTTPHDMATLTAALIRNYQQVYADFSIHDMTYNKITQRNRNGLLWKDKSVDGVKTGHTASAGYCLVASAQRGDMRLISVVMGAKSIKARERASQTLLNFGFRFYETHRLYQAGKTVNQVRVWKGGADQLPLGLAQDLYVTIPRGEYKKLKAVMDVDQPIEAPVEAGRTLGQLHLKLAGKELLSRPLLSLTAVPEGGLVKRLGDSVRLWFE